ncbi:hypothetical protein QAD02_019580 [Eretmocerus hayati]|uniref:Uncharacterized protein n=1 Tax=Eretmocerus hayati TaxID=131215 RepID=A0ACC2PL65_9HYME|nr:hypothetical protein QAD02_019580 [Eretmocerus hayati]
MEGTTQYDVEDNSDLEIVSEQIQPIRRRNDFKATPTIKKKAKIQINSVNDVGTTQGSYIKEEINISEASDSSDTDSSDDLQIEKCIIRRPSNAGVGRRMMNRNIHNSNGSLSSILLSCPKCEKIKTVYSTTMRSSCKDCHEDMDFVCEKCNNKYDSMPALYRHKKFQCRFNVPGGLSLYESFIKKCTSCSELRKEWRNKDLQKCPSCESPMDFNCIICSKWYMSHSGAYAHAKNECQTRAKTYYCHECNFKTTMYKSFLKHSRCAHLNLMRPDMSCAKCGLAFNNPKELKQHQFGCGSELYQCTFCVFKTESQEILREHTIQLHSNYSLQQSIEDIVNDVTIDGKSLVDEAHQTFNSANHDNHSTQNIAAVGTENGSLDDLDIAEASEAHCSSCNKVVEFSVGCSLRCKCGTILDYACKLCDRLFKNRQQLYRHIRRKHGKTKRVCKNCGRQFGLVGDATQHSKICGQEGFRYSCTMCSFVTNYRKNLQTHMNNIHTSNPSFHECNRCGAKYKCPKSFKRHQARCAGQ